MEKLERALQWVGMMVIGAFAAIAAVFAKDRWFSKPQPAPQASTEELLEVIRHNEQAMRLKLRELDALKQDFAAHQNLIADLQAQVQDHKSALTKAYSDSGKSTKEIADAFKSIKVRP
jgi:Skp family chaperone for outer membrane proteins